MKYIFLICLFFIQNTNYLSAQYFPSPNCKESVFLDYYDEWANELIFTGKVIDIDTSGVFLRYSFIKGNKITAEIKKIYKGEFDKDKIEFYVPTDEFKWISYEKLQFNKNEEWLFTCEHDYRRMPPHSKLVVDSSNTRSKNPVCETPVINNNFWFSCAEMMTAKKGTKEYDYYIKSLDEIASWKDGYHELYDIHGHLVAAGNIKSGKPDSLWRVCDYYRYDIGVTREYELQHLYDNRIIYSREYYRNNNNYTFYKSDFETYYYRLPIKYSGFGLASRVKILPVLLDRDGNVREVFKDDYENFYRNMLKPGLVSEIIYNKDNFKRIDFRKNTMKNIISINFDDEERIDSLRIWDDRGELIKEKAFCYKNYQREFVSGGIGFALGIIFLAVLRRLMRK